MISKLLFRPLSKADLPCVSSIIADNNLFPVEYLDEMAAKYLHGASDEKWYVAYLSETQEVVGVTYASLEVMTDKTWNLLLIAILKSYQNKQIGRFMLSALEEQLRNNQVRMLLIETSSLPNFSAARRCYQISNYQHIATIPDFYEEGDDKLVYMKKLK